MGGAFAFLRSHSLSFSFYPPDVLIPRLALVILRTMRVRPTSSRKDHVMIRGTSSVSCETKSALIVHP